jgi:hypothetical protein
MIYGPSPTRTDRLPPRVGPAAWGVQGESPSQVSATVTAQLHPGVPFGRAWMPKAAASSTPGPPSGTAGGGLRYLDMLALLNAATAYCTATAYGTATAGVDKWQEMCRY